MKQWIMLGLVVAASHIAMAAEKETAKPPLQLTVELTDGSRLIGATKVTSLPLHSEAFGKLPIPLEKIRTVKFSRDRESVTVALVNGDQVNGALGDLSLELRACFGDIRISVKHVAAISVSVPANARKCFSAAGDFSAESNPNGPWSYGWRVKAGEEFQLYTGKLPIGPLPDLVGWGEPASGPCVVFNSGERVLHAADDSVITHPGQLSSHPGPGGEYSVVRWTAQCSGRFQIAGAFTGLSGNNGYPPTTTDVHVFHNKQSIFDSCVNLQGRGNEASFEEDRDIRDGDTVDFVVGYGNGSHICDATGLKAVITPRPQPGR